MNDGDDIITVGNNNFFVYVYGQGGNDKVVGGWGSSQIEKLYGGTGDDKIWLVSPEQRSLDVNGSDEAHGGLGADHLYGTDVADRLIGDFEVTN